MANNKIDRINKEIAKTREKITEYQLSLIHILKRTIRRQQGRAFPVLKRMYSTTSRCLGYRSTPYPAMNV